MLDTETLGPGTRSLRQELLGNGATEQEIAAALGCSTRKVKRLNLPFRRVGGQRIYDVDAAATLLRQDRITTR
jgi:hypothetical protein